MTQLLPKRKASHLPGPDPALLRGVRFSDNMPLTLNCKFQVLEGWELGGTATRATDSGPGDCLLVGSLTGPVSDAKQLVIV